MNPQTPTILPPSIESVVETALYADDLDAAERFYVDILGLALIGKEAGRHVFFRVGVGSVLLIFRPQSTLDGGSGFPPHGAQSPGHFALGIKADSLDSWRQYLRHKGVTIEKEISWPRGGKSIYFRDPAGNLAELLTPGLWGTPAGW
jgi:catechol 2,3-dioxygenase-like lactoylglutathione lyase family enzyme